MTWGDLFVCGNLEGLMVDSYELPPGVKRETKSAQECIVLNRKSR